ncbi:hypothetical protein LguiB_008228 [Lonicera macranthoides]
MHGSSGCLGCLTKAKLISSVDDHRKGQERQARRVTKPNLSEDFWTTSTCDMDNSGGQSRGSISSISTSNQNLDTHCSGSGNPPPEFVNHGLLLWNQTRQLWVGSKRSENRAQELCEPRLSWNATYDGLLGSNKPFSRPIPLSEMVDFLVDIWEQEGMYD